MVVWQINCTTGWSNSHTRLNFACFHEYSIIISYFTQITGSVTHGLTFFLFVKQSLRTCLTNRFETSRVFGTRNDVWRTCPRQHLPLASCYVTPKPSGGAEKSRRKRTISLDIGRVVFVYPCVYFDTEYRVSTRLVACTSDASNVASLLAVATTSATTAAVGKFRARA